ncbi:MAG: phosphomethylpyrimidine synthase ThiC, partial [Coriobacteriia bacterium]|nr:phosphomethylpyrimidine synthase ThiC [Coriobacteriia bacterium]
EAGVIAQRERGSVRDMTADGMLDVVRRQAAVGVDFQTVHAAFTRAQAERVAASGRLTGVVSRGGAMLALWMAANDAENPFFERFDEVLEICVKHDVTLSLGDSLRPGCLADAGDESQMAELGILGGLVLRAREASVQVIVEGPGHVPLADVPEQMREAKRLCHGAPLYVLGPLVTDIAPGYDHITSAIGGAVAAAAGADFLCYVTPAEHVCLPDADDVFEGVVASRIAAHAGDIAKGVLAAREVDDRMARAREALDWDAQFDLAIDPVRPRELREQRAGTPEWECSMCGALCAIQQAKQARECLHQA